MENNKATTLKVRPRQRQNTRAMTWPHLERFAADVCDDVLAQLCIRGLHEIAHTAAPTIFHSNPKLTAVPVAALWVKVR